MKRFDLLRAYSSNAIVAVGEPCKPNAAATKTVRDLLDDVEAVSAQLPTSMHPSGKVPGEILVTCQDRYHLTVVLLAAWRTGHVVALPPNAREETLRELMPRCALALHDGNDIGGLGTNVTTWLSQRRRAGSTQAYPAIPAAQALVTIYTSGSTGQPSACRKTAAQLLGEGETLQRTFQLTPDSCVLATVPAHHIYGLLFSVTLPLAAGARFVRDTPLLPSVIEDYARRYDADVLISVPPHLRVLAESELSSLGSIRTLFSSGAPLPDATAHTLHRRFGVNVFEILGSTETGGFAYRQVDRQDAAATFRPFPGVAIASDDNDQLQLSSPLLEAGLQQPITCPDRIELRADGSFRHLGRSDGVIKVGGTRMSLAELEARVRELRGVLDVAALPADAGGARGQEVWLVVATGHGQALPELRSHLLRYYDPVLLPRRVRFVDSLPREATGKLMRARLLELFAAAKAEIMQP